MSEEIRVPVVADVSSALQNLNQLTSEIKKLNSTVESNSIKTSKAVKSASDSAAKNTEALGDRVTNLAKNFISLEKAAQAVKEAFDFLVEAAKVFEKQADMKTRGAIERLSKQFGQIQVEIGSVLQPKLDELSVWLSDNSTEIMKWARVYANAFGDMVKIVVNSLNIVSSVATTIVGTMGTIYTTVLIGMLDTINFVIGRLPFVPSAWKKAMVGAEDNVRQFRKSMIQLTVDSAKDIEKSAKNVADAFVDMFKEDSGLSNVTYKTEKQLADLIKLKEEQLNLIKDSRKLIEEIVKSSDNVVLESTMNTYEKQTKAVQELEDSTIDSLNNIKRKMIEVLKNPNNVNKDVFSKMKELAKWIESIGGFEGIRVQVTQASDVVFKSIDETEKQENNDKKLAAYEAFNKKMEQLKIDANDTSFAGRIENLKNEAEAEKAIFTKYQQDGLLTQAAVDSIKIDIEKDTARKIQDINEEQANQIKNIKEEQFKNEVSMAFQAANMITQIGQTLLNSKIQNIQYESNERLKSLDSDYANSSKYTKNTAKLDKQYAKDQEKIRSQQEDKEREAKNKQKKWSISQALISGGEATMNAWAQAMKLPIALAIPAGIGMSAVIAALTVAQVAAIASQKFAGGGIVKGKEFGDTVPIQANGGEMMINKTQQTRLWNMIAGPTQTQQTPLSIGGDTYIISGNLDENAVRQIRQMKEQRQSTLLSDMKDLKYRGYLNAA